MAASPLASAAGPPVIASSFSVSNALTITGINLSGGAA
jgi:hypothetical protein